MFFINDPKARSFTLLELLLGMLIASLVGLVLYEVLANGIKLHQKSRHIYKIYREAFVAFELWGQDVNNALSYDFSQSFPDINAFDGDEQELHVMRATTDGLKMVHFYTREYRHESSLFRHRENLAKFLAEAESPTERNEPRTSEEVLSHNLQGKGGVKFSYGSYVKDANQASKLSWTNTWHDKTLPAAVRMRLHLFNPDDEHRPIELNRTIYLSRNWQQ